MHFRRAFPAILFSYVCLVTTVQAQSDGAKDQIVAVPRVIRFAGSYHASSQQPPAGMVGATFSIYREQVGGTPLWREVQNVELDKDGSYTVLLGATSNEGVPVELFTTAEPRWLEAEIAVPGRVNQARTLLSSVPYALKASDADTLGGIPASAYLRAESPVAPQPGATAMGQSLKEVSFELTECILHQEAKRL